MKDLKRPALGLSIGATTLTAVTPDRSMVRRPLVMLPSGVTITDFVDRVGDPVGIVASDGSVHSAEVLLVDALRDFVQATGGSIPSTTAIAFPAHWRRSAVEAFRRALRTRPGWPGDEPILIRDCVGAIAALRAGPGLPDRGVIALLDLGGSGTSITLVDAGDADRQVGDMTRYDDFSGDSIDQALLAYAVAELSRSADLDVTGTSAIGSLANLRAECRDAKERLSVASATSLTGGFRVTRPELDELLAVPLTGVADAIDELASRAGVALAAIATVGGGASIPAVTAALSDRFRVPVVTAPRPVFTAAIGVALLSARQLKKPEHVPPAPPAAGPVSVRMPVLAWSSAPDLPVPVQSVPEQSVPGQSVPGQPARQKPSEARPPIDFRSDRHQSVEDAVESLAWYRRPLPVVAAALLVIVAAGAGTVLALRTNSSTSTVPVAVPSVTVTEAPPPAPVQAVQVPQSEVALPAPQTYVQVPAPVTRTQVVQAVPEIPAPEVSAPSVPAPQAPAPQAPAPEIPAPESPLQIQIPAVPSIPAIPQIPGLRFELPLP